MLDPESYGPEGLAVVPPVRSKRAKHVVADIRYGPEDGPSWSLCSCGLQLTGDTPDEMSMAYAAHQSAVGRGSAKATKVSGIPYAGYVIRQHSQASVDTCRRAGCERIRGQCYRHDGVEPPYRAGMASDG